MKAGVNYDLSYKKQLTTGYFLFKAQEVVCLLGCFSTLAHFTCVNGNSVIRTGNVGRRATKGGVADLKCAKFPIVQQRA